MKRKKKNVRPADIHKLNRDIAELSARIDDVMLTGAERAVARVLHVSLGDAIACKYGIVDHGGKPIDLLNVITAKEADHVIS